MENRTVAMNFEFSRQNSQFCNRHFSRLFLGYFCQSLYKKQPKKPQFQKVAKVATNSESSQIRHKFRKQLKQPRFNRNFGMFDLIFNNKAQCVNLLKLIANTRGEITYFANYQVKLCDYRTSCLSIIYTWGTILIYSREKSAKNWLSLSVNLFFPGNLRV